VQTVSVPRCEPLLLQYGVSPSIGKAVITYAPQLPDGLLFDLSSNSVSGYGTVQLRLRLNGDSFKPSSTPWKGRIFLDAGGRKASVPLTVTRAIAYVRLDTLAGSTRMGSLRESDVVVEAKGFRLCKQVTASFGGPEATVPAASVATDGTSAVFRLPRLAVPGIVSVTTSDGGRPVYTSTTTNRLDVRTYRSQTGLPFQNLGLGFDFADFERAFGPKRIFYVIPDPFWLTVFAGINGALQGRGVCFGMSLTGLDLRREPGMLATLPPGGRKAPFDLTGAVGPSNQLEQLVRTNQLKVVSHQVSDAYMTGAVVNLGRTTTQWADLVRASFVGGRFPVISLRQGTDRQAMHVVVPYDVRAGSAPGEFLVDVYDSNAPYVEAEDESFATHVARVDSSVLHVRPDGSWELPSSKYSGKTLSSIVVIPPYHLTGPFTFNAAEGVDKIVRLLNLPQDPTRSPATSQPRQPSSRISAVTVGGRALRPLRDGVEVAGSAVSVPWTIPARRGTTGAGRLVRARRGSVVEMLLTGTRAGTDRRLLLAPDLVAEVIAGTSPGETDRVRVGASGSVGFVNGGRSAPLTIRVTSVTGRSVELRTSAPPGASDTVTLAGDGVRIVHRGAPAVARITLGGTAAGVPTSVVTAPVRLTSGTTTIGARSWARLGDTPLTVTSGGRTRPLSARRHVLAPASALAVRVVGTGRLRAAEVTVRSPARSRGSLLTVRLGTGRQVPSTSAVAIGRVQRVRVPIRGRALPSRVRVVIVTTRTTHPVVSSVRARALRVRR
jgi:hypothetical protein